MTLLSVQQFMQEKHQSGSRDDERKRSGKQTFVKLQKKEKVLHMYKLSPQPEHKELFVTSYSRHAPVGGKQGGIQPGCNQYQSFYMLVSFL